MGTEEEGCLACLGAGLLRSFLVSFCSVSVVVRFENGDFQDSR